MLFFPARLFRPLQTEKREEKKEIRSTLILALSGTLGVGNITGVATSLILGGAGAVFWMLLSSIFAIALKYAESSISISRGSGEGIFGVLKNSFQGKWGRALSFCYAFVFLLLALILGGALQGNAILENLAPYLKIDRTILALALTFLLAFALFGKTERILGILSFTLPFATLVYIALCIVVLFHNSERLPSVFAEIFTEAFVGIRPAFGGIAGTVSARAISEGFSAGLLSNEAGAGTSALAHENKNAPERSGVIGVLEVLFDTTFLCTLSALTFLSSGAFQGAENANDVLHSTFFPTFGHAYILPLLISLSFLAISSNLCYIIYARRTLVYGKMQKYTFPYTLIFLLFTGLGGLYSSTTLVITSHILLFLLSILTSLAIIKNAN